MEIEVLWLHSTRLAELMLILAFLTSLTMHLLLFSYSQLKESIILEMQLTYAEAGFIFSMSVLALIMLRIPWGILIDRVGVRLAAGLALTLLGISGVLRGFAINYETLLLSQLLLGVGLAAVMPFLPKLVGLWFPSEKTGLATGVSIAGYAIGDIIGLNATPYLLMLFNNWRTVFFTYGIWTLILAVTWWTLAKEPSKDKGTQLSPKAYQVSSYAKNFVTLLKMKQLWLLTGLYLCAGAVYDTMLIWLPSLLETEGASLTTAGLITSMLPVGFLAASFAVGALSDRVGLRKPFILALGFVSGPVVYATGTLPVPAVWLFAFITGLCTIGVLTLVLTIPVELPQTTMSVASAVGLISSIGNVGSFLIPTVVGQIRDLTGSFLLAVLLLAILGGSMLILGLPITETGRKKRQAAENRKSGFD